MLTTNTVLELMGPNFPAGTLQTWLAKGLVGKFDPDNGGRGRVRRLSPVQALALVYGAALREQGSHYMWIEPTMRYVATLTENELDNAFKQGRIIPVPLPDDYGGPDLLKPKHLPPTATREQRLRRDAYDLSKHWLRVKRRIATQQQQQA